MASARTFRIFCPATTFKKSAEPGQPDQMRIAGVISTERLDHQGEKVLQKGLDLSYLLGERGSYNNEHGGTHHDILGFPQTVNRYAKGDILPNGEAAPSNCTWAEGVLLNEPDGIKTFQKAQALQQHGRSLGFSIEGAVTERRGAGGYIISKAKVNHVAITHQPVNDDTRLELLARSLKPRRPARKAMDAGGSGEGDAVNPLVHEDKDDILVDLAGDDRDSRAARTRKAVVAGKKRGKKAKKSRGELASLHSIFKALPSVGVTYALRLAAHMTCQDKGPQHAR